MEKDVEKKHKIIIKEINNKFKKNEMKENKHETREKKIFVTSKIKSKEERSVQVAKETTKAKVVDRLARMAKRNRKIRLMPSSAGTTATD